MQRLNIHKYVSSHIPDKSPSIISTNIMLLDIIHRPVYFSTAFWRLDSVSVFRSVVKADSCAISLLMHQL
jgi:hypothetical protein